MQTGLPTRLAAVVRAASSLLIVAAIVVPRVRAGDGPSGVGGPPSPAVPPPPAQSGQGILPIPDYGGDIWDRPFLLGDPSGHRTEWANKGIQFEVDYTQTVQSVVSGGRDTGTQYGGNLDYLVRLDLMRMGLVKGGLVTIRAESRYGNSVNGNTGSILPVNTRSFFPLTKDVDDPIAITITDLNYTQFLSEQFLVQVGKIDTLSGDPNEFASGRGRSQFMNANFVFNSSLALRLPYSTLGASAVWMPTKQLTFVGSVFNTADSSTTSGFNEFGKGTSALGAVQLQYRLGELPGGMNLGGLYSWHQDFAAFTGELIFTPGQGFAVPKKKETWALYWSGWQYLLIKDPDDKPIDLMNGIADHQGLGLFWRLGCADQDTNPVRWSLSGGIGGRGLIPGRKDDTYGVGYFYTSIQGNRLSSLLGVRDNSQGGEAFYNIAITPAAHLTFDIQTSQSPFGRIDQGVLLGARFDLAF